MHDSQIPAVRNVKSLEDKPWYKKLKAKPVLVVVYFIAAVIVLSLVINFIF